MVDGHGDVDGLVRINPDDDRSSGGTLSVPRPSSAIPYFVLLSPLPNRMRSLEDRAAVVLVIVSDPNSVTQPDVRVLQTAYGLTFAEARVAGRLAVGATVDEIAEQLQTAAATARAHLKHIFQKTHTTRQSELGRQILLGQLR